jgi:hypothetical protein
MSDASTSDNLPRSSPRLWSPKYLALLSLASLALTLPVPFLSASRFADLSNWYNDHLHHAYATWVFLHRGLAIYTMSFRQGAAGVDYPQAFIGEWGNNPGMVYPPGVFCIFLPATILGWLVPMDQHTFGAINIAFLLLFAHAGFFCFVSSLRDQPRGGRLLAATVFWLVLMRSALNGFFDVVWLGAAAAMQLSFMKGKPERTILWFGIAGFVHFRAVVVLPLAFAAFLAVTKGRSVREWPWRSLAAPALLGALALVSFFLMYPATAALRASHPPLSSQLGTLAFWSLALVGGAVAYGAWYAGGAVAAATSAIVTLLAISEMTIYRTFWWHSSISLALLMLPGTLPSIRFPSLLRQVGVIQMLALEALLWNDKQGGAFGLLTQFLTDYKTR